MQLFYGQERRFNYVIAANPITALVKYFAATIVLENPQHIDWKYVVKFKPGELLNFLVESRNKSMAALVGRMPEFSKLFGFNELPDVIVGRADSTEFYDELLAMSKANRHNHADFADFVSKPLSDLLVENRAAKL